MRSQICAALAVLILSAISVFAQGWNVELEGTVFNFWGLPRNATIQDDYVYVATSGTGLSIVNVSDPSNPYEIGFAETPSCAMDVAVSGPIACVGDGLGGLRVMDVSNPENPFEIGRLETFYAGDLDISGQYAYVTQGWDGIRVVDLSDPTNPLSVGACDLLNLPSDIEIVDSLAYIADGYDGLVVIDVSNPASPWLIGICDTPNFALALAVSGDFAFVADQGGGLRIINVANPEQPNEVGNLTGFVATTVGVNGDFAYVGTYNDLVIVDISNPSNPLIVASCDLPESANGLCVAGNHVYIATDDRRLCAVNVSQPAAPEVEGLYDGDGYLKDLATNGEFIFAADAFYGLRIVDASDPANPFQSSCYPVAGSPNVVAVAGDFAYVGGVPYPLTIFNISDPTNPVLIGSSGPWYFDPDDIAVCGEFVYFIAIYSGLYVVDISDPANPMLVSSDPQIRSPHGIEVAGNYAYVSGDSFHVLDVSTPSHPLAIGTCEAAAGHLALDDSCHYAYVAGIDGLQIIDITDPTQPALAGYFDTQCGEAGGIALSGDHAFVSVGSWGFQVINVADPANAFLVGSFDTPGYALDIAACGQLAYVSDRDHLEIYDCSSALPVAEKEPTLALPSFMLSLPHPNPLNATTVLSFELRVPSHVSLRVYDTAGRLVATLVDGWRDAGRHEANFDGSELASGIYIYWLEAGENMASGKMVLMK